MAFTVEHVKLKRTTKIDHSIKNNTHKHTSYNTLHKIVMNLVGKIPSIVRTTLLDDIKLHSRWVKGSAEDTQAWH